jgi:hypothetical protein
MKRRAIARVALSLPIFACRAAAPTLEARTYSQALCRGAATQVATGAESFLAFITLGWCDDTGPAVIAARWTTAVPHDSLSLRAFLFASGNLRDGRIFEAAYRAAIDSVRPAYERAAALLVLIAQFEPSGSIALMPGVHGDPWRALLMHSMDGESERGGRPLPHDARQRVMALAESITGGTPGSVTRLSEPLYAAASTAYDELRRSSP